MKRKKIINLIIGTNNPGKLREIKDLLPNKLKIYSPNKLKIRSPKENGKTFKENSLIKAKFFSNKAKMICLADDSGLEVDALDKNPGIFSSRWAGSKDNFNISYDGIVFEQSLHKNPLFLCHIRFSLFSIISPFFWHILLSGK